MAEQEGKVRSLNIRPIQSADLAFEVGGVIAYQNIDINLEGKAALGAEIDNSLNVETEIYKQFFDNTDPLDILFTVEKIEEILKKVDKLALFKLMSHSVSKASLRQAILIRVNGFFEKYMHADEFQSFYNEIYSEKGDLSKPLEEPQDKVTRLEVLRSLTTQRRTELLNKYSAENMQGVVSQVQSTTSSGIEINDSAGGIKLIEDQSDTTVKINPVSATTLKYNVDVNSAGTQHTTNDITNKLSSVLIGEGEGDDRKYQWFDLLKRDASGKVIAEINKPPDSVTNSKNSEAILISETSHTTNKLNQTTNSSLPEFKYPSKDEEIEHQRTQLDLQDEWLKNKLMSLKVPNISDIMKNELQLLNLDIIKLIHGYLQTVLIPPFKGKVTAIYKDLGETVASGEPVIRIENDNEFFIVGFIQYRGLLRLEQKVKLITKIFETADDEEITGKIKSIRGHEMDDDEWDIIIRCKNEKRVFPLNYHFDKDSTKILIVTD
jgi:hypothetical protein